MHLLTPVSSFDDVPELQTNEPALAGPDGPLNRAAKALTNRTQWLKENLVANFSPAGTGAIKRPFQAKLADLPVSLLDFYDPVTDSGFYSNALDRALVVSLHVQIPAGTYPFDRPCVMLENMRIEGAGRTVTTITAPNGFLKNAVSEATATSSDRVHITVEGCFILGTDVAGVAGITGPFGGWIVNNAFQHFTDHIRNASAFLSYYVGNQFDYCSGWALNLADFNGGLVRGNYFNAHCRGQLTVTTVTPQSGSNSGFPYVVDGANNFSSSGNVYTNNVQVSLRGLFRFSDNYFENYSQSSSGCIPLQIQAGQFDNGCCIVENNQFGMHGFSPCCINVVGTTALRCDLLGRIESNQFSNPATAAVIYGNIADGTNNTVNGLSYRNNRIVGSAPLLSGQNVTYTYRPMSTGQKTASISIAGATPVTIPFNSVKLVDNVGGVASTYLSIKNAGYYLISAKLTLQTTASSYPAVAYELHKNDVAFEALTDSLIFSSNPTRRTVTLGPILVSAVYADQIKIKAYNGQTVEYAQLTCEWRGDGNF